MKRILSCLLCMIMLTSLCCSALAQQQPFLVEVLNDSHQYSPYSDDSRPVIVSDQLAFLLPEGWEEVTEGLIPEVRMGFQVQDRNGVSSLYVVEADVPDGNYEAALKYLKEEFPLYCHTVSSGFQWDAGGMDTEIILMHKASGQRVYVLGISAASDGGVVSDEVTRDLNRIIRSLHTPTAAEVRLMSGSDGLRGSDEAPVVFEDPYFEEMTRRMLRRTGDVYPDELALISELYIGKGRMELWKSHAVMDGESAQTKPLSLRDLRHFPNLKKLYLCGMEITDWEELLALSDLEALETIGCGLMSCDFLKGLDQLTCLNLGNNEICDLSPLSGMSRLEFLNLSYNPVASLAGVENLTALKQLYINGTDVASLEELRSCAALEELQAGYINGASLSLEPLSGLTQLRSVNIQRTEVHDEESVSHVQEVICDEWQAYR